MTKKKKKKKNKNINLSKKVLDGIDTSNKTLNNNFDLKIQNFISILFTIIIFIALIILILVLSKQFLFKEEIDKEKVCEEYITKDYDIKEDMVKKFVLNLRGVIYNVDNFDINNYQNEDLLTLTTYFIWQQEGEYLTCDTNYDINCLVSYKYLTFNELKDYFKYYFNIDNLTLNYNLEFDLNKRLYQIDDRVILTFDEFLYQTLKHDIIDISILEDEIKVIMALSSQSPNGNIYKGYKKIILKYDNNNFIIKNIETVLNDSK